MSYETAVAGNDDGEGAAIEYNEEEEEEEEDDDEGVVTGNWMVRHPKKQGMTLVSGGFWPVAF